MHGGGIDDGAAAGLAHNGDAVLGGDKDRLQTDVEGQIPVLFVQFRGDAVAEPDGVVEEDVKTAIARLRALEHGSAPSSRCPS